MISCPTCRAPMQRGIALVNNVSGLPDFSDGVVCTVSPDGTAYLASVMKCTACGYSIRWPHGQRMA